MSGGRMQEVERVSELLGVVQPTAGAFRNGDPEAEKLATRFAAAAQAQPLLLDAECVAEALRELRRLMPAGTDVCGMLLRDPAYLLRVQRGQKRIGVHPDSFPDASYLPPPRAAPPPRPQGKPGA
jgi:hypothetical protein